MVDKQFRRKSLIKVDFFIACLLCPNQNSVTHAAMTTQTLQMTWVYRDYQNKFAAIEQP